MSIRSIAAVMTTIALSMTAVIAQENSADNDAPDESLSVTLPRAELDTERIASLTSAIEDDANEKLQAKLLDERAKQYMRSQQWNKAAADFRAAARLQPGNSMHWMRGAVLLQLAENRMNYDQLANEMLNHYKETTNPYNAERTAKMCWLPAPPVDERELAEKLADLAMERRFRTWGEYYPSTRALGYFRYQEYDKALKAIAESDRLNAKRAEPQSDLDTINRVLEAMCLAKLGRKKEATAKLTAATTEINKNVAEVEALYANAFWNDWLLATVLQREARELIAADDKASDTPHLKFDSPQAAYDAVKRAYDNQDWITFAKCHDDDGQTTHAAVILMSAFVKFSLIADDEQQQERFDAVEAICKKYELKPLLTFVGQLGMFGKIDFGNLTQKQNDRIVGYLRAVKNKPAFIAEVHKLVEDDAGGKRIVTLPLMDAKLVRSDIDGDKAQAVMQGKRYDEPTLVQFRKMDGSWIISAK